MTRWRWAVFWELTTTNSRMMAPRPQQMQSMKERLKTVSFLRFISVQTSDRDDGFSGVSQADRIADIQRHRAFNLPIV